MAIPLGGRYVVLVCIAGWPAACLVPAGGRALPFRLPPPVPPFEIRIMRLVD